MDKANISLPNQSVTREISGLSAVLLGFILLVIFYSIFKLLEIGHELREVAEIDIPLTEVVSEVEVLQLQQHILLEQIRLSESKTDNQSSSLTRRFESHADSIRKQLHRADNLIEKAISSGQVSEKLHEHQQVLQLLKQFNADRESFTAAILSYLQNHDESGETALNWPELESRYLRLDNDIQSLLIKIEELTEEIVKNTEKHEQEFMLVNIGLGISALLIGIHITLYIVGRFRKRVSAIQHRLADINDSLDGNHNPPAQRSQTRSKDELHDLSNNIDFVLNRFENELSTRYEVEEQLIELATTDKLTGALNRHKWDDSLNTEIELARRGGVLSLVSIDLDHFKAINDNYGHDVGDIVLVRAVQLIQANTRKTDLLFRLGGEEFVLMLRQIDQNAAASVAEKLREAFENYSEQEMPAFTASFGVVQFSSDENAESFVRRADQALYQSKNSGRNRVTIG